MTEQLNWTEQRSVASNWTTRAFAICLCRDWTLLQLLIFNTPWGSSGWSEALCAPGNLVGQLFRWLGIFRNWFHDPNPCISSYLGKSTKSFYDDIRSSWVAENLLWTKHLMVLNSPFTQILYIDLPQLLLLSSPLRAIWGLPPGLQSSFCPQIKLNSQLSSCASFLVDNNMKIEFMI